MKMLPDSEFVELFSSTVILFNIRLSYYVLKMNIAFHGIQNELLKQEILDSDLEENVIIREKWMIAEFERRFSRVYLYPIHLKLNKLKREIATFHSADCCKIILSFSLRNSVLSLLKCLNQALHVYFKFMRKLNTKVYFKLHELLNYICYAKEIISFVVDFKLAHIQDLSRLCNSILKTLENRNDGTNSSQKSNKNTFPVIKHSIIKVPKKINNRNRRTPKKCFHGADLEIKEKKFRSNMKKMEVATPLENSPRISQKKIRFNISTHENQTNVLLHVKRSGSFRSRLSSTTARLCEAILNDLVSELVTDISFGIHDVALETFAREFATTTIS